MTLTNFPILTLVGGVHLEVPLAAGEKTGWFYHQRSNREAMQASKQQFDVVIVDPPACMALQGDQGR
jgi:23S rRNA G2069 N7-methylase RlmK/C1962 C5-methylase RlmI